MPHDIWNDGKIAHEYPVHYCYRGPQRKAIRLKTNNNNNNKSSIQSNRYMEHREPLIIRIMCFMAIDIMKIAKNLMHV